MKNKGIRNFLENHRDKCRVIIYGMGINGKLTYDYLKKYQNVEIVGWVDRYYDRVRKDEYPMLIQNPCAIRKMNADFIIIAVTTERYISEICNFIKQNCENNKQIVLIDSDEFDAYKRIQLLDDTNFQRMLYDWKDYIYLRDKYSCYVSYKEFVNGEDSGIIWLLWLQGWDNAPELVKKCRESVEKYGRRRKVICLDEKSYMKYVNIPEDIQGMYKKGIIGHAHYSDIIRLELLTKYGGLWIDATVLLTGELDNYIIEPPFFVYQFSQLSSSARTISNWLMFSQSNNIIIEETLKLLYIYWRKEKKVINYFLMHFLFRTVTNIYDEEWKKVPYFSNSNCHVLGKELGKLYNKERLKQILKMSNVHKLNHNEIKTKGTVYEYIINECV